MKILVVGSINMDLVVRLPQIPKPGETLLGGTFNTFPGGKGANQAVAIARLGGKVTMVGAVGVDSFGDELIHGLEIEGIDTQFIQRKPGISTGVALIEVDSKGQNTIAVASGANYALLVEDVRNALVEIGPFDILVMPLETPIDTIIEAVRFAKMYNAKTILNPAPAQKLSSDLLRQIDYLVPNEFEIGIVSGSQKQIACEIDETKALYSYLGVANIIITMGNHGVIYENPNGKSMRIPAYNVEAVDTTAAGDCFVGAFAVGLSEGHSTLESIQFANAAAALSVERVGAQPSLPHRNEVDQFLNLRRTIQ
jgi:ribokinase